MKYGPENVKVETLWWGGSAERADYIEKSCIKILLTKAPLGYNETDGGDGCNGLSAQAKDKIRDATKKRFLDPNERDKFTAVMRLVWADPEARARRSAMTKKRFLDPVERRKMSIAAAKAWTRPETRKKMLDIQHSPEVRARRSASVKAARARTKKT